VLWLRTVHAAVVLIGFLTCCLSLGKAQTTYIITDLGALPGMDLSEGNGINAAGEVVGTSKTNGVVRAFVYTPGRGMIDLGTLGGQSSYGDAINASGQVTGVFDSNTGGHAYLYTPGVGMTDLGSLIGASGYSRGFAINASGQIAGEDNGSRAFLYTPGAGMTAISLPGTIHHSAARGINDAGQVTGYFSNDGGAVQRAFVYTPGQGIADLRTLTGQPLAAGLAINGTGQVTGCADTGAFVYTPAAGAKILGSTTCGQAINSSGHVVGYTTGFQNSAFLYTPIKGVVNLNTLLTAGSGWTLMVANGINDAGQITGIGTNSIGALRAFLLSPTASFGTINVSTNLLGATFLIRGTATYSGAGLGFTTGSNAPTGTYTITYGSVFGYTTPPSQQKALIAGGTVSFSGVYLSAISSLTISPQSLSFSYPAATTKSIPSKTLLLSSSATQIGFLAAMTTGSEGNWLTVTPRSGTTPATIQVSVGRNLPIGTYKGRVTLSSLEATNTPLGVPVTVTVTKPALFLKAPVSRVIPGGQQYGADRRLWDQACTKPYYHTAIDYAPPAAANAILAAADGIVASVPNEGGGQCRNHGLGRVVILQHTTPSGPLYTLYAHLARIDVKPGDVIKQGTQIGLMGDDCSPGKTHLHFELKTRAVLQNPVGQPCGISACAAGSGYVCYGYTQGNPDNFGYFNPTLFMTP
jgi:probable HAF family extracellular repeat protein